MIQQGQILELQSQGADGHPLCELGTGFGTGFSAPERISPHLRATEAERLLEGDATKAMRIDCCKREVGTPLARNPSRKRPKWVRHWAEPEQEQAAEMADLHRRSLGHAWSETGSVGAFTSSRRDHFG